ncbi:MAG: septum formation initiator family protein [Clostridia bacterium]|nr:septum formation initiator family protein [Clostridia bacterium]
MSGKPVKRKPKKQRSIIVRVFVLGVCVYMIVTLGSLLGKLNESRAELKALKEQETQMITEINELRSLLEGDNNKIIEKAARERLGYIYPDEQIFEDISGN